MCIIKRWKKDIYRFKLLKVLFITIFLSSCNYIYYWGDLIFNKTVNHNHGLVPTKIDSIECKKYQLIHSALYALDYDFLFKSTKDSIFTNQMYICFYAQINPLEDMYSLFQFYRIILNGSKFLNITDYTEGVNKFYTNAKDTLDKINFKSTETIVLLDEPYVSEFRLMHKSKNTQQLRITKLNLANPVIFINIASPNFVCYIKKINDTSVKIYCKNNDQEIVASFIIVVKKDLNVVLNSISVYKENEIIFQENNLNLPITNNNAQEIFDKYLSMIEIKE